MKPLLILVLYLASLSGCSPDDHQRHEGKDSTAAQTVEYYTCPMHPSVRSDRPGACPVCGMALVKKTAQRELSQESPIELGRVSLSPTQRVIANVSTQPAEIRNISVEITAAGVVAVAEPLQATLTARFRGRIEKLAVNYTGETVRKGQALFELYSPDLVSAQQEFLLALSSPSAPLADTDIPSAASDKLLESARERLRVHFGMTEDQITEIEQSRRLKKTTTFYAPLSGTVITKNIIEGEYVDEGTVLYEVANLSRVWIYFDVYEQDIRSLRTAQEIRFTSEAYPGEIFAGRISFVDPVMNPETRTVRVRTEALNVEGKLKPQMFVSGLVDVPPIHALSVLRSAVLSLGRHTVVWVEVEPNTFEPRTVSIGTRNRDWVQILSGLHAGEQVVVTGGFLIDSESSLRLPATGTPHAGHSEPSPQSPSKQRHNHEN